MILILAIGILLITVGILEYLADRRAARRRQAALDSLRWPD